jgi:23S rRNA (cytosine1962-C5)-methyltransferase
MPKPAARNPRTPPFAVPREEPIRWLPRAQVDAFLAAGTNAFRLATSVSGWVERFADDLLLSYQDDATLDRLRAELEANAFTPRRVYGKFLPRQNAERIAPVLLEGDATLPPRVEVTENGVRYGLDFEAGYSAGLFLDQRHNRAFLRRRAPKRVLNTFAYTCSFSVVAALAGARTSSLDLSAKSLDRGRENFALNALSTDGHVFLADDVLEVLPRLVRRGEKFDAIILDPPTFSRGAKGRKWQVEEGLESLLLTALELASPGAAILVSTNCARLHRRALEQIARFCLKTARLAANFHLEPELPDIPSGARAQTLWLLLK